jgi:hypothetical protein
MKTFLVATGDDPEGDEKVDKAGAGAAAGKGSKVKGGKAKADTKKGGKSDTITTAQMKAIGTLVKDKGITPEGYLAVVAMTVDVPEGTDANALTKGLSSKDAGAIITSLGELTKAEPAEEASGAAEDTEGMTIV